jgi:hypothetical protein
MVADPCTLLLLQLAVHGRLARSLGELPATSALLLASVWRSDLLSSSFLRVQACNTFGVQGEKKREVGACVAHTATLALSSS